MIRTVYALLIAALIGGAVWAASGSDAERPEMGGAVGLVILAALQR